MKRSALVLVVTALLAPLATGSARTEQLRGPPIVFSSNFDIYVLGIGGQLRAISAGPSSDGDPAWSPDHRRVVFRRWRGPASNIELWVMDADGSHQRRLTQGPADRQPDWSPDGKRVVFVGLSPSGRTDDLYVVGADGGHRIRLTTYGLDDAIGDPSWSPDGKRIAFWRQRLPTTRGRGIQVMNADGTNERRVAIHGEAPSWSPNGGRIAFARDSEVWVMNANGSAAQPLYRGAPASVPAWSPDGDRIAFARDGQVAVMNADGSGVRSLTAARGQVITALDW